MPLALASVEPLERITLGDQVYAQLSEMLIAGKLTPGDRLSLRSAAEQLGVSMMPVREAVNRLVADGGLEVAPNRAVRVPILTVSQFRDLTRVRVAIEGHAAAEAALRRSAEDLAAIAQAEAAFLNESRADGPDLPGAVEKNKNLHFAVYRAAGSPILVEIIRGLWLKAGPVINLDLRDNPNRLRSGGAVDRHAEMTRAIVARDPEGARGAMAADIANAAEFILSRGRLAD